MVRKIDILNTLVLNGSLIYMSLCAIIGIRFDPEEGAGPIYKIYMAFLFLLGILIYLRGLINRKVYTVKEVLPLLVLAFYIFVGFFQLSLSSLFFIQMVCFSVPATCIALNMRKRSEFEGLMRMLDLLLPFFSLSFVFMVININLSKIEGDGAAYDQTASYFIAYCFLVDLFLLRYKDYYKSFHFLDNKWYRLFKVLLLPYFIVMAFFSGGRGAFVTILVGLFFNIGLVKKINPRKFWLGMLSFIIILILVVSIINKLNEDFFDLLSTNFERIYALIEGGHLDTSASSGRDQIWAEAFDLFMDNPLLGYGLFSYMQYIMYPHNFVLEILLQGGLIMMTIFVVFFVRAFGKFRKILKEDKRNILLLPFIIYSLTQLLFSGSYTFEPFFWFVLSYIYAYNLKYNIR